MGLVEARVDGEEPRVTGLLGPQGVGELGGMGFTADTEDWLLRTFTDQDFDVADDHSLLRRFSGKSDSSNPEGNPGFGRQRSCGRRLSQAELSLHVTQLLVSPTLQEHVQKVGSFDFDAVAFCHQPEVGERPISLCGARLLQVSSVIQIIHEQGFVESKSKFHHAILSFFGKLDDLYKPEALYHNHSHAVDVMSTVCWLLRAHYFSERVTISDYLMSLMAAAVHDVGHFGRNNLFLSKTMDPLALRYNDKSILENMHVALAFETMQADEECNWLGQLRTSGEYGPNPQQYMRKGLINMVLATDPTKHSKQLSHLKAFVIEEDLASDKASSDNLKVLDQQLFLLSTMLHAADISNPTKPRNVMLGWTQRILAEFWDQGDEERKLGLPISPLCDREAGMATIPKGQMGFIGFVVQPLYEPVQQLICEVQLAQHHLAENVAFWKERDAMGSTYVDIFGDLSL